MAKEQASPMRQNDLEQRQAVAATAVKSKAPAVFAMIFGVFLILGMGFAHSTTIHNAAHDSRHSNIFPCH